MQIPEMERPIQKTERHTVYLGYLDIVFAYDSRAK